MRYTVRGCESGQHWISAYAFTAVPNLLFTRIATEIFVICKFIFFLLNYSTVAAMLIYSFTLHIYTIFWVPQSLGFVADYSSGSMIVTQVSSQ